MVRTVVASGWAASVFLAGCSGSSGTLSWERTTTPSTPDWPVVDGPGASQPTSEPTDDTPPTSEPGTDPTEPVTTPEGLVLSDLRAAPHPDFGTLVQVSWEQSAEAEIQVEFSLNGGDWQATPARTFPAGPNRQWVIGGTYQDEVSWRLVVAGQASDEGRLTLGRAPSGLPRGEVLTQQSGQDSASPYFLISLAEGNQFRDPWWVMVVDRQARTLWAMRSPNGRVSMHSRVARDGRSLYIDLNSYWPNFDGGVASTIDQMLLDGTVLHTFEVPGLHHPFTDLPDGSVAWGATTGGYRNEYLRVVDRSGRVETLLDCEAFYGTISADGFCMSNTLSYHEPTNRFLFSLFSTESVLEIDRASGEVTRWFGHLPGAYAFDPPQSEFWWQHGAYLTEDGTLLLSSDLTARGEETIVREYSLHDDEQVLREVWNFGIGEGVYGHQMGEVVRLNNGNILHNYGEASRLREANRDREVLWDASWDSEAIGRSMPIADLYDLLP